MFLVFMLKDSTERKFDEKRGCVSPMVHGRLRRNAIALVFFDKVDNALNKCRQTLYQVIKHQRSDYFRSIKTVILRRAPLLFNYLLFSPFFPRARHCEDRFTERPVPAT